MTTKHLGNGSMRPRDASTSSKLSAPDPLDRARERLNRAAEATRLLEYSEDFDEPTGRTDVNVHLHHPPQPSYPDVTDTQRITAIPKSVPPPGPVKWLVAVLQLLPPGARVIGLGMVIAALVVLFLKGVLKWP